MSGGYIVMLIRGPLDSIEYQHTNEKDALRRVHALCNLHSCGFEQPSAFDFRVDASAYYKGADVNKSRARRRAQ